MPSLSRRHIELLRVHATAALAAALVQAKYYRERPDEAARMAKRHRVATLNPACDAERFGDFCSVCG